MWSPGGLGKVAIENLHLKALCKLSEEANPTVTG